MKYDKIFKWILVVLFVFGLCASFLGYVTGWPDHTEWKAKTTMLKEFQGEEKDIEDAFKKADDKLAQAIEAYELSLNNLDSLAIPYKAAVSNLESMVTDDYSEAADALAEAMIEDAEGDAVIVIEPATPSVERSEMVTYYIALQKQAGVYTAKADSLLDTKEMKLRKNKAYKTELENARNLAHKDSKENEAFGIALLQAHGDKKFVEDLKVEIKNMRDAQEWVESTEMPIWVIMYYTMGIGIVALLAVFVCVFVITGINNWKSLLKLLGGIAIIVGVIFLAYALADGGPVQGAVGDLEVTKGDLMLTDTILNLAYLMCGGVVVSLVVAWIYGVTRK